MVAWPVPGLPGNWHPCSVQESKSSERNTCILWGILGICQAGDWREGLCQWDVKQSS